MASFKTTAQPQFCTSLDVRDLADVLKQGIFAFPKDESGIIVSDPQIDSAIVKKSRFVNSYLYRITGGITGLTASAPYYLAPVNNVQNAEWGHDQAPLLQGVTVAAAAITELWTLRCTDNDGAGVQTFSVYGSISGGQGTLLTNANFTATDGDLIVPSSAWRQTDTTYQPNDRVYVSVNKYNPDIADVTAKLVCADILDAIFSEISPNASDQAKRMRAEAMAYLKLILDGKIRFGTGGLPSRKYTSMPYNVTNLGDDVTEYEEIEGARGDSFDNSIE